ncbi:hypothetical protein FDP41_001917 [Naegleria fowleri]|uniref:Uncharacterized protein n=1 Tax=Naegleria fowleri TaxID=5763 RepID=A0A6A5BP32_NAEFO|nr:uncharacterized protein FDP41_001917 [Naegleria fowleri]KAF0978847.1 hypothetical protein FDP41_001917 [Naegleria fowleri]CAG4717358.1 unnamed protein product [Naegleria fowleri]
METPNSANVSAVASSTSLLYSSMMIPSLFNHLRRRWRGSEANHGEQEASPSNVTSTTTSTAMTSETTNHHQQAASRNHRQHEENSATFHQPQQPSTTSTPNDDSNYNEISNRPHHSQHHYHQLGRHSRYHANISLLHSSEREDDSASTTDGSTISDRMGGVHDDPGGENDDNHSQSSEYSDQEEAFMMSPSSLHSHMNNNNRGGEENDDEEDDETILFTPLSLPTNKKNKNIHGMTTHDQIALTDRDQDFDDDNDNNGLPTKLNLSPIKAHHSSSPSSLALSSLRENMHPSMASPLLLHRRRSSISSNSSSNSPSFSVATKRKLMAATPGGRLTKTSTLTHLSSNNNTTTTSMHPPPPVVVDQHSPLPHQYSFMFKHEDHMKRFRHTRYQTGQLPESGPYRFDDSREIRNKLSLTNTSDIQNVGQYEFNAVRLTTCDWFINGWQKTSTHMIRVQIDIYKKKITFSYENIDEHKVQEKLVIAFDDITGLEFQHSPLSDDIVVIEVNRIPTDAPTSMRSNFFFLYLSKEDSAKYMDGALLSSDKRLLKLAIVGLPTWATIVNRYGIPIFYNHQIRGVITTLVNIYIIISLIWGFYDLYKNLPIVGGALRAIFGPVASFLEPIIKNKIMLLIPLVFSKVWEAAQIFFSLFAPLLSIFTPLWKLIVTISHAITNVFKPLADGFVILLNGLIYPFIQLYHHVLYPLFNGLYLLVAGISRFLSLIGTGIYTAFKIPVQFIGMVSSEIVDMFVDLFYALSTALSYPVTFFKLLFSFIAGVATLIYSAIIYPFTKLGSLFKFKKDIEHATQVMSNVASASSQAASTSSSLKAYLMSMKENFQPLSSLWNGIRRIIDSIIHTYHTKIKHRSVWKRRILITIICLIVLAGVIIVFALVF